MITLWCHFCGLFFVFVHVITMLCRRGVLFFRACLWIVMALLSMVQHVSHGFQNGGSTLALLVDANRLEGFNVAPLRIVR